MSFTAAIIGRPNVGKSTLFNRLVGRKLALVDDTPGVTRDRREGEISIGKLGFRLIDTAGLEEADPASLPGRMRAQTETAMDEADICLFLIDARSGITPADELFSTLLRKSGKPVILIANKCEGAAGEAGRMDAYRLGLGEPIAFSAEHGLGTADLYQVLQDFAAGLPDPGDTMEMDAKDHPLRIAILGRPNAGKSTLINTLLGKDRLLTGPEAGITRDAISIGWQWQGRQVTLWDTAGLRRKARVREKLEKLSVADGLRAIRFAEVAVLLIDAACPFEKQDLHLADLVAKEGRALIIAVNKWDLVEDRQATMKDLREKATRLLPQWRGVPIIGLSALTGRRTDRLMPAVVSVYDEWNRRLPTGALNRWLERAVEQHEPPAVRGRRIRLRYVTQPKARPPTFIAFCQRADDLPTSYVRYLVNDLRREFNLPATPIRFQLRKGKNPYVRE